MIITLEDILFYLWSPEPE